MISKMIEVRPWGQRTIYTQMTLLKNNNPFYRIKPMMGPNEPTYRCEVTYELYDDRIFVHHLKVTDCYDRQGIYTENFQTFNFNAYLDLKQWAKMFSDLPTPLRTEMTDILYGK